MHLKENRKGLRLLYRNSVQYEEFLGNGSYSAPIMTTAIDLGDRGISIYTNTAFELNAQLRISHYVSDTEQISYIVNVVRLQTDKASPRQYIVGAEIKDISSEDRQKFDELLNGINIYSFLDKVDLDQVTDIHFMVNSPLILKKLGKLQRVGKVLDEQAVRNLLVNTLDDGRYEKLLQNKDVNYVLPYKDIRLRVNIHFQQGKMEGIFRVINSTIEKLAQLGLPPVVEHLIKDYQKGLILIAGRTGSGKTTTLASMVRYLSSMNEGVIIIIEDPIEYVHDSTRGVIKQRELGRDTISYASATRNALRQNPDVLVIGEILDVETLDLVLTAAESGTLVLTTIHAPTSAHVLDRIASFFPAEMQKHILYRVSLVLKGIITQELFPRITGKNGLVPAVEVFLVNDYGRKIIREGDGKLIPDYLRSGKNLGMQTMQESLEQLVNKGIVDVLYLKEYL